MLRHAVAGSQKNGWAFDPAFKSAAVTLSNGNRTATHDTGANYDNVLGLTAISGKKVMSFTVNSTDGSPGDTGIGVGNHSAVITSDFLGNTADSGAMYDNGNWYTNGSSPGTLSAGYVATNVVDMAVDEPGDLVWFRVNGGNWNNNALNDPATGVGGQSISGITGTIYPGVTLAYVNPNAAQITINAASPYALPSGFSMM